MRSADARSNGVTRSSTALWRLRRRDQMTDLQWVWLGAGVVALAVLVLILWPDLTNVYRDERDVAITIGAAFIGFCFAKAREDTEEMLTAQKLVQLLADDPTKTLDTRFAPEIRDAFVEAVVRVVRRPPDQQPAEVRDVVLESIVGFLHSVDFMRDDQVHVEGLRDSSDPNDGLHSRIGFSSVLGDSASSSSRLHLAVDDAIRKFRDDHQVLAHLTRVDRDVHACGNRLAEFWDQRAGSSTFPDEAPLLEVIMCDVNSAADAVIQLNQIFRNHVTLLGTEPLDLGLSGIESQTLVPVAELRQAVHAFQSGLRSVLEAKNRYFDAVRIFDSIDAAGHSINDQPNLRIAGADVAKALRVYRSLSFRKCLGSQKGQVIQIHAYLTAARDRLDTYLGSRTSSVASTNGSTGERSDSEKLHDATLTVSVMCSDLDAAITNVEILLVGDATSSSIPQLDHSPVESSV